VLADAKMRQRWVTMNDLRITSLALGVQATLVFAAGAVVGMVGDLALAWDRVTFIRHVQRALILAYGLAAIGALWMPGAIIRRWPTTWASEIIRVAPLVGPFTLVGSCLGLFVFGRVGFSAAEAILGKIEHNSLWGIPLVGLALFGCVCGCLVASATLSRLGAKVSGGVA
jgi:hypothetical protein